MLIPHLIFKRQYLIVNWENVDSTYSYLRNYVDNLLQQNILTAKWHFCWILIDTLLTCHRISTDNLLSVKRRTIKIKCDLCVIMMWDPSVLNVRRDEKKCFPSLVVNSYPLESCAADWQMHLCLCRVWPWHQRGELWGILLAWVLLQLQEVLPLTCQQALRDHWRSHLLPRLC